VGCFDVYRVPGEGSFDPTKNVKLRQFLWKYTAEAQGGTRRLSSISSEVSSDMGTTYGWNPGTSIQLHGPTALTAAVDLDLQGERDSTTGSFRLSSVSDGWDYQGLPGWIDPRLEDKRFVVRWTAEKGGSPGPGESPQVAGATVWGIAEPAPDVMGAHLKLEVESR
jgi:hypothetical protein